MACPPVLSERAATFIVSARRDASGWLKVEASMKFKVALYPSEEGVAVCAPALPGCWSQGETVEEALANIAEAIREYLEAEVEPAEGAELSEVEVAV